MRAVYFCLPITIIIHQKQRLLVSPPIQLVQILQIVEELVSSFYLWPFLPVPEANIRQAELQLSL